MKDQKIKGLHTPNVIVGMRGWMDARCSKTASVEPETKKLVSGYFTVMASQFHAYEAWKVDSLEKAVKLVRMEASELMTEYSQVRRGMDPMPDVPKSGDVSGVRQYRRVAARRKAAIARLNEIESRLMEINIKLRDREHHVRQDLNRVMGLIKSKYSAYAHGMMLRPVSEQMIPAVSLSGALDVYHDIHRQEDACIQKILQEVYHG